MDPVPFHELTTARYCRRKLFYRRLAGSPPIPERTTTAVRDLAFSYESLRRAADTTLAALPIAIAPDRYRDHLETAERELRRVGRWEGLCHPQARDVLVEGIRCRGVIHKLLSDPLEPAILSTGRPPGEGVWPSEAIHATAAATALAQDRIGPISRAWLEYPAHGVVRPVPLTARRRGRLHRELRAVRDLETRPPPTADRRKCTRCEFAPRCGLDATGPPTSDGRTRLPAPRE